METIIWQNKKAYVENVTPLNFVRQSIEVKTTDNSTIVITPMIVQVYKLIKYVDSDEVIYNDLGEPIYIVNATNIVSAKGIPIELLKKGD